MLGKKDKAYFKILAYKNTNNLKDSILQINYIPKDINESFRLPEQTTKIIIQENDYDSSLGSVVKNISTIYIGLELDFKQILTSGRRIEIDENSKINLKENEQLDKKRLLVTYSPDGAIIIKKELLETEIAMDSLYDVEYYLKVLGEELTTINKDIEDARKILKIKEN